MPNHFSLTKIYNSCSFDSSHTTSIESTLTKLVELFTYDWLLIGILSKLLVLYTIYMKEMGTMTREETKNIKKSIGVNSKQKWQANALITTFVFAVLNLSACECVYVVRAMKLQTPYWLCTTNWFTVCLAHLVCSIERSSDLSKL